MPPPPGASPSGDLYRITLSTLSGVAKTLAALPEQRKALIFVSAGHAARREPDCPAGYGRHGAAGAARTLFRELFAIIGEANRSNISVYGIDPGGLRVKPESPQPRLPQVRLRWTPAASRC